MRKAIVIFFLALCTEAFAQVNIWDGTDVKQTVQMTPYLVQNYSYTSDSEWKKGLSVIICPGGSYFWHDMEAEGTQVAKWLNSNGITAFVLRYRTAAFPAYFFYYRYIFRGTRYPDAQKDLRRALEYVKEHSAEFQIDPNKIGAMGFSAGGHLVMSSAVLFTPSERPSFIVPIYPVVSMSKEYTHARSRRALLGERRMNNKLLRDSLSLEKHIPEDCPPVFLINCKDDPIVDYRNSVVLDSALTAKKIPHKYIQYMTGGHGFGADPSKGSAESREWRGEFLEWLKNIE